MVRRACGLKSIGYKRVRHDLVIVAVNKTTQFKVCYKLLNRVKEDSNWQIKVKKLLPLTFEKTIRL